MPPDRSRKRLRTAIKTGAPALALVLLLTVVLGGSTGGAATPSCGATCVEFSSPVYGSASTPAFVLADAPQLANDGQPVTIAAASAGNQGEDFTTSVQGTVSDFINAGLANDGLGPLYGSMVAIEIQYSPSGNGSGSCVAAATTPANGTRVILRPCGVDARTVWILDNANAHNGSNSVLINLDTQSNFSDPQVLTTLLPGQPLLTSALRTLGSGASAPNQQWGTRTGPF